MTYGERWYEWKCSIYDFNNKIGETFSRPPKLHDRMSRADASKYYRDRCVKVFRGLGMIEEVSLFERRLPAEINKVQLATKRMLLKEARKNNRLLQEMVG